MLLTVAGAGLMPGMHTTLKSPAVADVVEVTEPVPDEAGSLVVDSTVPLHVDWDVPAPPRPGQRMALRLTNFFNETHAGALFCSWPLGAGHGTVTAALLTAVRTLFGGNHAVGGGFVAIETGGAREVKRGGASYSVVATKVFGSTSFPGGTTFDLQ